MKTRIPILLIFSVLISANVLAVSLTIDNIYGASFVRERTVFVRENLPPFILNRDDSDNFSTIDSTGWPKATSAQITQSVASSSWNYVDSGNSIVYSGSNWKARADASSSTVIYARASNSTSLQFTLNEMVDYSIDGNLIGSLLSQPNHSGRRSLAFLHVDFIKLGPGGGYTGASSVFEYRGAVKENGDFLFILGDSFSTRGSLTGVLDTGSYVFGTSNIVDGYQGQGSGGFSLALSSLSSSQGGGASVPDSSHTLALLSMSLIGFAFVRRKAASRTNLAHF